MRLQTLVRTRARLAIIAAVTLAFGSLALPSDAALGSPVITAPAAGSVQPGVAPATVRIAGTAVAGASVEVFDSLPAPASLGTTTASPAGAWSLSVPLAGGAHSVSAVASDGSSTSAPSAPVSFEVDAARPNVTIIDPAPNTTFGPTDQVAFDGSATDDRALHAIKLEFWRVGKLYRQALAPCTGCDGATSATWSYAEPVEAGTYTLKVWSVDEAANYSLVRSIDFTYVGGGAPLVAPPLPIEIPEIVPPEITTPGEGDVEPGATEPVTFTGGTEPGSTVEVFEEVAGLGSIGTAVDKNDDGAWHLRTRLPSGTYGVRARATDADGNVSDLSELIVFEVDGDRPVLDGIPSGTQFFAPTQPVEISAAIADEHATGRVVLEYWLLDELVLRDLADCPTCGGKRATWSHEPTLPKPGYYHVRVLGYDAAGNPSTQTTMTFVKTI